MRQGGVIIGKLGRDQRSGVRDQKRKDLRRRGRGSLGGGGLDNVEQWSEIRGCGERLFQSLKYLFNLVQALIEAIEDNCERTVGTSMGKRGLQNPVQKIFGLP